MDELKNIAPELSQIKKENPFRVPNHYFDDFQARLQMKIEAEKEVVPVRKNPVIQFLKPALGLAASFALIFMLVYWPLKTFSPKIAENKTENSSASEKEEYLSMVENIDENSFYALLYEPSKKVDFSDEDLMAYININATDYDIYQATEF